MPLSQDNQLCFNEVHIPILNQGKISTLLCHVYKQNINLTFIKHDKLIVDSSNKTEICRGLVYCKSLTPTFNRLLQLATDVCSMLYTLHNKHFIGRITKNLYFFTKKENSLATQTPIITVRLSIVTANWIPFISTRAPITIRF